MTRKRLSNHFHFMKNIKRIKVSIGFVLCLFYSTMSFAGFEPGFLVTQEGDTLHGAFKFNMSGIKFKPKDGGKSQLYALSQIAAYSYSEDIEVYFNFENLFYTLTIDDEVQLYERTSYIYTSNGQFTNTIIQNSYAVKRKNEKKLTLLRMTSTMGRGKTYFVKEASLYFQDFPELVADIENGKYNRTKTIKDMVSRYNRWWNGRQKSAAAN